MMESRNGASSSYMDLKHSSRLQPAPQGTSSSSNNNSNNGATYDADDEGEQLLHQFGVHLEDYHCGDVLAQAFEARQLYLVNDPRERETLVRAALDGHNHNDVVQQGQESNLETASLAKEEDDNDKGGANQQSEGDVEGQQQQQGVVEDGKETTPPSIIDPGSPGMNSSAPPSQRATHATTQSQNLRIRSPRWEDQSQSMLEEAPSPEEIRTAGLPGSPTPIMPKQKKISNDTDPPDDDGDSYVQFLSSPSRPPRKSEPQRRGLTTLEELVQHDVGLALLHLKKTSTHVALVVLDVDSKAQILIVLPHVDLVQDCSEVRKCLFALMLGFLDYKGPGMEEAHQALSDLVGGVSTAECQQRLSEQLSILFVSISCPLLEIDFAYVRTVETENASSIFGDKGNETTLFAFLEDLSFVEWSWRKNHKLWSPLSSCVCNTASTLGTLTTAVDNRCSSFFRCSAMHAICGHYAQQENKLVFVIDVFLKERRVERRLIPRVVSVRSLLAMDLNSEEATPEIIDFEIDKEGGRRCALYDPQSVQNGCWFLLGWSDASGKKKYRNAEVLFWNPHAVAQLQIDDSTTLYPLEKHSPVCCTDARGSLIVCTPETIFRIDSREDTLGGPGFLHRRLEFTVPQPQVDSEKKALLGCQCLGPFLVRMIKTSPQFSKNVCWSMDVIDLFSGADIFASREADHSSTRMLPLSTLDGVSGSPARLLPATANKESHLWYEEHLQIFDHDHTVYQLCEEVRSTLKTILAMASARLSEQLQHSHASFEREFVKLIESVEIIDGLLREKLENHHHLDSFTYSRSHLRIFWDSQLASKKISFAFYVFEIVSRISSNKPSDGNSGYLRSRKALLVDRVRTICFLSDWRCALEACRSELDDQKMRTSAMEMLEFCDSLLALHVALFAIMYFCTKYSEDSSATSSVTEPSPLGLRLRHAVEAIIPFEGIQQLPMPDFLLRTLAVLEENVAFPFLVTIHECLSGLSMEDVRMYGADSRADGLWKTPSGNARGGLRKATSFHRMLESQSRGQIDSQLQTSSGSKARNWWKSVVEGGAFKTLFEISRLEKEWVTLWCPRRLLDSKGNASFVTEMPSSLEHIEYKWLLRVLPFAAGEKLFATTASMQCLGVRPSLHDYMDNLSVWVVAFSGPLDKSLSESDKMCCGLLLQSISDAIGLPSMDDAASLNSAYEHKVHTALFGFSGNQECVDTNVSDHYVEELVTEVVNGHLHHTEGILTLPGFSSDGNASDAFPMESLCETELSTVTRYLMRSVNYALLFDDYKAPRKLSSTQRVRSSLVSQPESFTFELMVRLYYKVRPSQLSRFINFVHWCCPLFLRNTLNKTERLPTERINTEGARDDWPLPSTYSRRLREYCEIFELTKAGRVAENEDEIHRFRLSVHKRILEQAIRMQQHLTYLRALLALPPPPVPFLECSLQEEGYHVSRIRGYSEVLRHLCMPFEAIHLLIWHGLWSDAIAVLERVSDDEQCMRHDVEMLRSQFDTVHRVGETEKTSGDPVEGFLNESGKEQGDADIVWRSELTRVGRKRAETTVKHGQKSSEEHLIVFSTLLYHSILSAEEEVVPQVSLYVPKSFTLDMLKGVISRVSSIPREDWLSVEDLESGSSEDVIRFEPLRLLTQLLIEQKHWENKFRAEMSGKQRTGMFRTWKT